MMKSLSAAAALASCALSLPAWSAQTHTRDTLKSRTSVSMEIFADLSYIRQQSDGVRINPSGYGFEVKRGYLTFNTKFDALWSARLRTDFTYDPNSGNTELFIKHLYVQRDFKHNITLRIGSADLPWVPWIQDIYRLRYVEKVMVDYSDFGTSADWGLHLSGNNKRLDWQVSLVSGAGYKHPGRSKGMNVAARVAYNPLAGLQLAIGGHSGKRGMDQQQAPAAHTATRWDAAIAYVADKWRVGLAYFHATNWNNVTTNYSASAHGYSLFAHYSLNPTWSLFARYDRIKPCEDLPFSASSQCYTATRSTYYNAGVQYIASDHVRIALVYKYNRVASGFLDTANGLIGGNASGKYQEIGLFMEASF